ncbi:putative cytochrome P450 [Daldinia vernicosa]|uniref:putative cytochrome P450 n=1 Tax=Daldinia vernicosa TaxID=114800 RepID=UPI0020075C0E|nr:putative cytochrome P450 [Daldinia vernicosa]KAI0850544.1 putative cytochrome P450 [Daldinia vernicosa]
MIMGNIHIINDRLSSVVDVRLLVIPLAIILWIGYAAIFRTEAVDKVEEPAQLKDPIPFIFNTFQNLTNMGAFLDRAIPLLRERKVIRFNLALRPVYWITGPNLVQKLFVTNSSLNSNIVPLILIDKLWGVPKEESKRFADDKTGRLTSPIPGTMTSPDQKRLWHTEHQIYDKYLTQPPYSHQLGRHFFDVLAKRLDEFPTTEWTTINLFAFMRYAIPECAIITMFGPRMLELNPGLVDALWDVDANLGKLVWGLPSFITPQPYKIRDGLRAMMAKYLNAAWANFDWNGPDADSDWDVHFGARVSREIALWMKENDLSIETASGHTMARLFGINGNSVPSVTWAMMESLQRPGLLQDVRDEAQKAITVDANTRERHINTQKLLASPLLQAIFQETLRMHTSFMLTREARETISIGGYRIEKGSLIQAPTDVAHYEEAVWAIDGHPASEFWPGRHIRLVEGKDESGNPTTQPEFFAKARPSSFFPFGGGNVVCPGRHFARQQIIMSLAIIVSKFDIEFIEWTTLDGKKSDRPPRNSKDFAGTISTPPDRDMKIRWKRRW